MDYFNLDPDRIPTQSAFIQRRKRVSLMAFQYLFSEFSASFPKTTHSFLDQYCVLAVDGTHLTYTTNAENIEDYYKPRLVERKGHNHMHLNGFVDVNSKAFLDIIIQPGQAPDERQAMHAMIDHFHPDDPRKYIITADRGYESYDMIFHCELKDLKYVFRVKAPSSPKSLLSSFISELPDDQEEFDTTVMRFFTDKKSAIMKKQDDVYHYMNPSKNIPHFKELLDDDHLHYLQFRVVKIKVAENSYEYIITNLPYFCTLEDIKECYHLRWGIEVSYRFLKHANGLLYFHTKDPELLKQEVYANLILYNLGIFLANKAADENRKKRRKQNKYVYDIDISSALKLARKFLIWNVKFRPGTVIKLMMKYVHAVKTEVRHFDRPLRGIGSIHFGYR
jgi:hypothetical protein